MALAALALVVFGAYDSYPFKLRLYRSLKRCSVFPVRNTIKTCFKLISSHQWPILDST